MMGRNRRRSHADVKPVSYAVLVRAVHGEADAMDEVLRRYMRYMRKLATRPGGKGIDTDVLAALRTKLIAAVMSFDPY